MKILVAYDGTLQSKKIVEYGIHKAGEKNGQVVVLHIFRSGLFLDYEAGLPALEAARDESRRQLEELKQIIGDTAHTVPVQIISAEGDPGELINQHVAAEQIDLILVTPRYKSEIRNAPVPVQVIPGTILVPVDNSDAPLETIDIIVREAIATESSVFILGLVPIHLYSQWEKKELNRLRKETISMAGKVRRSLKEYGIDAVEIIRSGYPDEEILKAADEYSVSMIVLPTGGKTPSELSKAAAVLLDEPERLKRPVMLFPVVGTA